MEQTSSSLQQHLKSPWVHQIQRIRPLYMLETDLVADVCIIGGGISGILSAYHILKHTDRNVVLLDSHEIGHGATGHNAGQLVDELERSVVSLVEEFGLEKTIEGLRSVREGWGILEEILQETGIAIPYSTFVGYTLYSTQKQILEQLVDLALMHQGGLHPKKMYISEEHIASLDIPHIYKDYYQAIPHKSILSIGETINPIYIGAFPDKRGCLNSALLVEQLTEYMCAIYNLERFQVYENTCVQSIELDRDTVAIQTEEKQKTVCAHTLILCTNGFERFTIKDIDNSINHSFHKHIKGVIGYMFGQTEEIDHSPSAFSYQDPSYDTLTEMQNGGVKIDSKTDVAYAGDYVYTTRRPYDIGHEEPKNLFCLGGKARVVEDSTVYTKTHEYHPDIKTEYEDFILTTFGEKKVEPGHKEFIWHGLMGYTTNGVRMVGFEKKNKLLMYNLGCNGVGILPSVWSGKRIANLLLGDTSTSMFDPK